MDFKTVTFVVQNLIENKTGLKVKVESDTGYEATLILYAKKIQLGSTTVTKTLRGKYIIGGRRTGVFMSSGDSSLIEVLSPEFHNLEDQLNGEKND